MTSQRRDRGKGAGDGPADGGAGGPRRVGDLVGDFLGRHGLDEEVERQRVLQEWPEAVGPEIAAVTEARSVSRGVLFVAVRSSAWLMELSMMKREILERLNRGRDPALRVERIVFVQGGEGEPGGGY